MPYADRELTAQAVQNLIDTAISRPYTMDTDDHPLLITTVDGETKRVIIAEDGTFTLSTWPVIVEVIVLPTNIGKPVITDPGEGPSGYVRVSWTFDGGSGPYGWEAADGAETVGPYGWDSSEPHNLPGGITYNDGWTGGLPTGYKIRAVDPYDRSIATEWSEASDPYP